MSEHGPYNQPPHNPYGGGEHGGGQPPYGQPYGDPNTGGQPGPPGQPYGDPNAPGQPYGDPNTGGQPGFNTGGQPGPYPGGPYPGGGPEQQMYGGGQPPYGGGPEQQMYGGGQPPYGGGPPGYPQQQPPQPPPNNEGKAGLWVVIGGGAVIVVLVIAVVAMLITNGSGGEEGTTASDDSPDTSDTEGDDGDDDDTEPEGDDGGSDTEPAGEPPFDVPTEPCDAFTDQVESDFLLDEEGDKSVQDSQSTCRSSLGDPPEGNPEDAYGSLNIAFSVPPSAADSTDRASEEFETGIEDVTGQSDYSLYYAEDVDEDKAVELGDEAHFVTTMYDFAGDDVPQAVLLVRTENLNIRVEYQVSGMFLEDEGDPEDLQLPDDVEELMLNAGEDALEVVGTS